MERQIPVLPRKNANWMFVSILSISLGVLCAATPFFVYMSEASPGPILSYFTEDGGFTLVLIVGGGLLVALGWLARGNSRERSNFWLDFDKRSISAKAELVDHYSERDEDGDRINWVKVRFNAAQTTGPDRPVTLDAKVDRRTYNRLKKKSTLKVSYLRPQPSVAVLEGER